MSVTLKRVTKDNWRDVIALEVAGEQRRLLDSESVLHFLAEAQFYPSYAPYAIYDGETLVGFVSFGYLPDDPSKWWVPFLIIDRRHQRKGYGRAAMQAVIHRVREEALDCEAIGLCYKPENAAACRLYRSLGFGPADELDEKGEIQAWLRLKT